MKIKNSRRAAFFKPRLLVASLLCIAAGMLTLFAFGFAQQPDARSQTTSSFRWLTRLASTLGIQSERGGAIKLDKEPVEQTALSPAAIPYSGPPRDLRPVAAVRSGKLRDIAPIDPATVPKIAHPEPIEPNIRRRVAALRDQFRRRQEIGSQHRHRPALTSMASAWASLDSVLPVIPRT